jgi:hypothetical protein
MRWIGRKSAVGERCVVGDADSVEVGRVGVASADVRT